MMPFALVPDAVVLGEATVPNKAVLIEGAVIAAVVDVSEVSPATRRIRLEGMTLAPGFI